MNNNQPKFCMSMQGYGLCLHGRPICRLSAAGWLAVRHPIEDEFHARIHWTVTEKPSSMQLHTAIKQQVACIHDIHARISTLNPESSTQKILHPDYRSHAPEPWAYISVLLINQPCSCLTHDHDMLDARVCVVCVCFTFCCCRCRC